MQPHIGLSLAIDGVSRLPELIVIKVQYDIFVNLINQLNLVNLENVSTN